MPAVQFVQGDLQSLDLLNYILRAEEIDTVLHFAAQVGYSLQQSAVKLTSPLLPDPIHAHLQTHVDNSFGNSLAFTMNNTYGRQ